VISVAFYIIALSLIFKSSYFAPVIELFESLTPFTFDIRMISLPIALVLFGIILKRGANIGIQALWVIFALLIGAVALFLFGAFDGGSAGNSLTTQTADRKPFVLVFAICFPAFTGMTAGIGLSGDLKDPKKSIPNGILLAILTGLIIYIFVMIGLWYSSDVNDLADPANELIMVNIAGKDVGGYLILIGLGAATISSAIGSILIAPRTMQALGSDKIFPNKRVNKSLGKGYGKENEPINATLISSMIAIVLILMGDLNAVAQIITMFFLITYGTVCLISFLEHFAGNPSYRPTFRTKWYFSLLGAILCFFMMFQIHWAYAIIALLIMAAIHYSLKYSHKESRSMAVIFQGVMFQVGRWMKLALQKSESKPDKFNWRPSVIAISSHAVERSAPKDLLRWISHHYGFGTLIHYIKGVLNKKSVKNSHKIQKELVEQINVSKANYSVSTVVSPSLITAVAQSVQFSGISGLDNNTIMFEFNQNRTEELPEIVDGCRLAQAVDFNICVLRSTEHNFGYKERIHIWITEQDFRNGNLMILLSFIVMEHPEWADSEITIYTAFPAGEEELQVEKIKRLISRGRLPITLKNVKSFSYKNKRYFDKLINRKSKNADLVIVGFTPEQLEKEGAELFKQHKKLQETLFVMAGEDIFIK
ncbi:MAG: amino acid permease, partial [Thermoplasmata archaeon]|nr:amino acid permease [Thermoplasmata archaeon]